MHQPTPSSLLLQRPRRTSSAPGTALVLAFALSFLPLEAAWARRAPSDEAVSLRNLGFAQLENEKDAEAEATYRRLASTTPRDPLPHANLAIALLRQQRHEEALAAIDRALALAPGRADLLAIRGDVLSWSGRGGEALSLYRRAFAAAPNEPEIVYALFRQASTLRGAEPAAESAFDESLEQLVRLRPDNVVVLLEHGQRAIEQGDRAEASRAYLRLRELVWAMEPRNRQQAERVLPRLFEALEGDDVAAARVPSLQLGNVMRSSGRFKSSLAELTDGIQGMPVERFVDEPETAAFGGGAEIRLQSETLRERPGRRIVTTDWDGDDVPDMAWGGPTGLSIVSTTLDEVVRLEQPVEDLLVADLDNDLRLDLLVLSPSGSSLLRGTDAGFSASDVLGPLPPARRGAVIDFDSDGDLDLASAGADGDGPVLRLHRNSLSDALEPVGTEAFPEVTVGSVHDLLAGDIDRDGDPDLLLAGSEGVRWLDNLRQGRFRDRTRSAGLARVGGARAAALGDLDNDGIMDLVLAGSGDGATTVTVLSGSGGSFRAAATVTAKGAVRQVELLDLDNDGFLDIALATEAGLEVLLRRDGAWVRQPSPTQGGGGAGGLAFEDRDRDGDLDLLTAGDGGVRAHRNDGGNANGWLRVNLRGLTTGNDKNNSFGYGASLEIRSGAARQVRDTSAPVTHFGLGSRRRADTLRVVWNNGVPQNRIAPEPRQTVVEEQVLKGSCPFLYTWTGDGVEFVTDLLWGAPIGMPVAEGIYAEADPHELVVVRGAQPRDGFYDLRITEELWEAAYFDLTRLWVVDHPADTEATGSLRVVPGPAPPPEEHPDRVLLASDLRPVRAIDGRGRDVTERVAARDDVYADGYTLGPYQGISEPWTFTIDLGEAPESPVRLLLDGWIFPADASLNIASSQRDDLDFTFTRLEVETDDGWQPLVDPMGFPAGKTKTTVVDTPELPAGASRLRIVTSRWLHWDRIVWTTQRRDAEAVVVARLEPSSAELGRRGFSELVRRAPNAPHEFDYDRLRQDSPWIPFPGRYTRLGDVRELLTDIDGGLVVMAAGDEIRLLFPAADLPPVAPGMARTLFLESYGWDKDADRNTLDVHQTWPLPPGTTVDEGQRTEPLLTRRVGADSD